VKICEKWARVARISFWRSSFGPDSVCSCGSTTPAPKGVSNRLAMKPVRT
jgi:hypothetical protein